MSVIIVLCEDPCPVHDGMLCLLTKDHPMPHRGALTMPRERSKNRDRIVIEWRQLTRRCRFCGNAEEMCHSKPCRETGDGLHSIEEVTE